MGNKKKKVKKIQPELFMSSPILNSRHSSNQFLPDEFGLRDVKTQHTHIIWTCDFSASNNKYENRY
jgi:hypothetical protein